MTEVNIKTLHKKGLPSKSYACLRQLQNIKELSEFIELLTEGRSGAQIWQVRFRQKGKNYDSIGILKIGKSDIISQETHNHRAAGNSTNHPLMPKLISEGTPVNGWQCLLFSIAKDTLWRGQNLSHCIKTARGEEAVKDLCNILLKWYSRHTHAPQDGITFIRLLHNKYTALKPNPFKKIASQMGIKTTSGRIVFEDEQEWSPLPNPFYVLMHGDLLNSTFSAPLGPVHGDLHTNNIVVSNAGEPKPVVIDFALFIKEGSILHDLAFLEISIVLDSINLQTSEGRTQWEKFFKSGWGREKPDNLPTGLVGLWEQINNIRQVSDKLAGSEEGLKDQYSSAYIYAIVSAALRWVRFDNIDLQNRWGALYVAARALKVLEEKKMLSVNLPTSVTNVNILVKTKGTIGNQSLVGDLATESKKDIKKEIYNAICRIIALHGLDDDKWAKAISAQYFLVAIGKTLHLTEQEDYKKLLDKFMASFSLTKDGNMVLSKEHILVTPEELNQIVKCMMKEDQEDKYYSTSTRMRAQNINANLLHYNYLYGLIVQISGVASQYTGLQTAHQLALNNLTKGIAESPLEAYGGWYPYRVPWVTARILISLKNANSDAMEKAGCSESIINKALESLVHRIFDEKYWRSGVGSWVTKWESTALCLEALEVWGDYIPKHCKTAVKKVIEYVMDQKDDWLIEPNFSSSELSNQTLSAISLLSTISTITQKYFGFKEFSFSYEDMLKYFRKCIEIINDTPEPTIRQFCTIPQIAFYTLKVVGN